jgi:hypothetical protein
MDFLFKQFPLRNSFTIEDSKLKKWKRESILGKRSFERNAEESKEEHEVSLITDLKGLERYEEKLKEEQIRKSKKKTLDEKKKYISDFFGEQGMETNSKRKAPTKRYVSTFF